MTPLHYDFLHITGMILLFAGFGSMLTTDEKARRFGGMLHGIGWLVILVAGFGFLAKANKPNVVISYTSVYVIVKTVILLLLGFLPVLAKKGVLSARAVLLIAIALGIAAAYIGFFKPLSVM